MEPAPSSVRKLRENNNVRLYCDSPAPSPQFYNTVSRKIIIYHYDITHHVRTAINLTNHVTKIVCAFRRRLDRA